jgi:hypothetical protein
MQTEAIFENIEVRLLQEIRKAKKSIIIVIPNHSSEIIFNELVNKAKNGCTVSILIVNNNINLNTSVDLKQLEIEKSKVYKIENDNAELINNNFFVIDYNTIITGSYTWNNKIENNFENIVITNDDKTLAGQFVSKFNNILKQYYPDAVNEEIVFPLNKIVKRLEILKNYILLEDIEELNNETSKLKEYDFNSDLQEIVEDIRNKEFASAITKIQNFISKHQQLSIWTDPEIAALQLEIKILENQLSGYDNEKMELEKILSDFHHRHTVELGDIILNILKLRKLKFKENKAKFEEAENDERQYREQVKDEKTKELFELTEEEKSELKRKFRKATILCHPDKVSDEFKEAAQRIFVELKQAYDTNNLKKVSEILEELEKGNLFRPKSETILEKDSLKVAIAKLKRQIKALEEEIIAIKDSETFKTIKSIDNWDEYFTATKNKLQLELESLQLEIGE